MQQGEDISSSSESDAEDWDPGSAPDEIKNRLAHSLVNDVYTKNKYMGLPHKE